MAWIPIYADHDDFISIITRLNDDLEIAYIKPYGEKKWIAKRQVERLINGDHCLWHIPGGEINHYIEGEKNIFSGALQRLLNAPKKIAKVSGTVANPWKGWKGPHISGKNNVPYLGSEPNIIHLTVNITGITNYNAIGMSCFGWIANRYKAIGKPAHNTTANWWNRLRRWIKQESAAKITRFGPFDGPKPEIWAFPSAYEKIKYGTERETNAL